MSEPSGQSDNGRGQVPAWLAERGISAGGFMFEVKERLRRLVKEKGLSSQAHRIHDCLALHTMAFRQELAVKMVQGRLVPLTPADIAEETGIAKQNVSRGLAELEERGLAERRSSDGGRLRKAHVEIYSWALPREPKNLNGKPRDYHFPSYLRDFPEIVSVLKAHKRKPLEGNCPAREHLLEIEAVAREHQEREKVLLAMVEKLCAPRRHNKEEETGKKRRKKFAVVEDCRRTTSRNDKDFAPCE